LSRLHKITLAGLEFIPDLSGALYVPDCKTLLVADLHLEQGASLARRGVHVPPFDTGATLALLESVTAATRPWRMVLLGDSFHDSAAHAALLPEHRARLMRITSEIETVWISGNHDPDPPQGLGGVCVTSHELETITLRHRPAVKLKSGEIAGHLHPGATIVQRGVAARGKCFIADERRIIMPAFGSYTGALSVRSRAYANLFDETRCHIWLLGRNSIHRFPLGRVT
jgi:DNA ligase-associated metallophosphoesterase